MDEQQLQHLRGDVDAIDDALMDLIERRQELARAIGKAKGASPVFDPGREQAVIARLRERHPAIDGRALEAIQREVISLCRSLQEKPRVAFMGPEGSFSQEAARRVLGQSVDDLFVANPWEAFAALERGEATLAVVPIENTVEGVVYATLDAFAKAPVSLSVAGEVQLPIVHVLATAGTPLEAVTEVRSHPQALAQCRHWLEENLPEVPLMEAASTGLAAQMAAEDGSMAAIASEIAASLYGLQPVKKRIEDNANNYTRFLVIGRTMPEPSGRDKTSLMFSIADQPGILCRMLAPFSSRNINLTKIESRPIKTKAWEYVFFVDLDGHADEPLVAEALEELRACCRQFKVLGSYPRSA